MESITSLQNPKVKLASHLREPRQRKKHQLTLVEGLREVRRALDHGAKLHTLFVDSEWLAAESSNSSTPSSPSLPVSSDAVADLSDDYRWILQQANRLPMLTTSPEIMAKISFGDRRSPFLAIIHTPSTSLESLVERRERVSSGLHNAGLILVLDQIEKPGNLGAAARTADAVGVTALFLSNPRCEVYNPNAIRASLGAVFTIPVACGTAAEIQTWLRDHQYQVLVARLDSSQNYSMIDYRQQVAVVIGNEATGVSSCWNQPDMLGVRLPMLGIMDSLNASVTASVILYEAIRQRRSSEC